MPSDTDINIQAKSQYIDEQSTPDDSRYAFAYTVTISNDGDEAVQLMSRHWYITDGNNRVQEVQGEGVIGKKPIIEPGKSFRYSSGAMLETAVGMMEGSYHMVSNSGEAFDAAIPPFSLTRPGSVH